MWLYLVTSYENIEVLFDVEIEMEKNDVDVWFENISPLHRRLMELLVPLLENFLKMESIDYLSVSGRIKTKESFLKKIDGKKYKNPKLDVMDVLGLRVVTFFRSQVSDIGKMIERNFVVDNDNSQDNEKLLGMDKIGYRSVHFVCSLNDLRKGLPEYNGLEGLKFEIQVRTVLQHAWAELAHDNTYKFSDVLPQELHRKVNLYSGILEVADNAFEEIAKEIANYKDLISKDADLYKYGGAIDSINLMAVIDRVSSEYGVTMRGEIDDGLVKEILAFGCRSLEEFSKLLLKNKDIIFPDFSPYHYHGTVRDVLMLEDINKYFADSFGSGHGWGGCDEGSVRLLMKKYKKEKIFNLFERYDIFVSNE